MPKEQLQQEQLGLKGPSQYPLVQLSTAREAALDICPKTALAEALLECHPPLWATNSSELSLKPQHLSMLSFEELSFFPPLHLHQKPHPPPPALDQTVFNSQQNTDVDF